MCKALCVFFLVLLTPPVFSSIVLPPLLSLSLSSRQVELEEMVKREHARIDSQDRKETSREGDGAAAKADAASVARESKKEE